MNRNLRVLITGTNKGIGNDLVKIFYRNHENATIYATSRESSKVAEQRWQEIDPLNQRIKAKYLDINSLDSIQSLSAELSREKTLIDVVIHNAAVCDNLKD